MMKRTQIRSCLVAFTALLAAVGQAQGTAQTDVTVPSTTATLSSILRFSLTTTLISDTDLITASGNNFTLPSLTSIRFDYQTMILLAGTNPAGVPRVGQGDKVYVDQIRRSVDAMNHCITLLQKGTVGLDVYNLLVTEHRKALKASLQWAKYLREHSSETTAVDALTSLVPQLEAVGKYTGAVNGALSKS